MSTFRKLYGVRAVDQCAPGMCGRAYSPRFLWMWPVRFHVLFPRGYVVTALRRTRRSPSWVLANCHRSWLQCRSKSSVAWPEAPVTHVASCRDPTKHSTLKDEIEQQSTAYYASARLWDDGIIKPVDTRDTVGLALALAARERNGSHSSGGKASTTWDGDAKGFGVFRM